MQLCHMNKTEQSKNTQRSQYHTQKCNLRNAECSWSLLLFTHPTSLPKHPQWMRLSVPHPLIDPVPTNLPRRIIINLHKITILEHLGKPETLHHVIRTPAIHGIDVADTAVRAAPPRRLVDGYKRVPRPVLILAIACRAVGVVVRLDDLGTQLVSGVEDEEAVLGEEGFLARGHLVGVPPKHFRANAAASRSVGGVAAVDEG